jgi:hypothetical protein
MSPDAEAKAQRILDRAARRILAERKAAEKAKDGQAKR